MEEWGCKGPGEAGGGTRTYPGEAYRLWKAVEATSLDLGGGGGSSSGSPVKPWASVLTSLGFGFPISEMGST